MKRLVCPKCGANMIEGDRAFACFWNEKHFDMSAFVVVKLGYK